MVFTAACPFSAFQGADVSEDGALVMLVEPLLSWRVHDAYQTEVPVDINWVSKAILKHQPHVALTISH